MKKFICFIVLFAAACGSVSDDPDNKTKISKSEAAAAMDGSADAPDYCEILGWYDDGICDDFCALPDPDCNPGCPPVAQPICADGTQIVENVDPIGCVFWTCEPVACPPVAQPICSADSELVENTDEIGCTFWTCEPICPQLTPPPEDFCGPGRFIHATTDPNTGCVNGFICVVECPQLIPPPNDFCDPGEGIEPVVDPNTDCTTGFVCVPTCPEIVLPPEDFCKDDEVIQPSVDPITGCVTSFVCVPE